MDLSSEKANQGGRYIVRKERGKYERPTLRGLVGLLGNDCTYRSCGVGRQHRGNGETSAEGGGRAVEAALESIHAQSADVVVIAVAAGDPSNYAERNRVRASRRSECRLLSRRKSVVLLWLWGKERNTYKECYFDTFCSLTLLWSSDSSSIHQEYVRVDYSSRSNRN